MKKDTHIKPPHVRVHMDELRKAVEQEELQEYRELYSMMQRSLYGLTEELKRLQRENDFLRDRVHRNEEMFKIAYHDLMAEWMQSEHYKKMTAYQPTEEERLRAERLDQLLAEADKLLKG